MDTKRVQIDISTPLMNEYLEEYETASEVVEMMQDDTREYDLRLLIDKPDMIPTAIGLSLSKRHNVDYYASVKRFPGAELIYGFLKSSYYKEVEWIDGN